MAAKEPVTKDGYVFQMYLPDDKGLPVAQGDPNRKSSPKQSITGGGSDGQQWRPLRR